MNMRNAPAGQARRRTVEAVGLMALLAAGACTLLVDRNSSQCQTDGDCAKFGNHPYCQSGVCVESGLQPAHCFYGTPQTPQDFENQCSLAECLSFDNCARLGICDGGSPDLLSPDDGGSGVMSSPVASPDAGTPAGPTVNCMDPTNGRAQVIYITGSSNFPPLLAKLAPLLVQQGFTPVFQTSSSCAAVNSVYASDPSGQYIFDPKPSASAKYAAYYDMNGAATPCLLGPNGAPVDIGESDIFASTCGPPASPTVGEYLGPIQAMVFVVPSLSGQTAITAEAAKAVFGAGGAAGVAAPWTNPDLYFVRNANTGTQQMIGHAIDVPADAFWGIDRGTAQSVDSLLRVIADPARAEQAIGIISADYYDADRGNLKALAFKASDQECAYLPDSTESQIDKANVRDGHYPIWGPLHFFTNVSDGIPVSAGAQAFVSVATVARIPTPLLDAFIGASLVPTCAMKVQRSSELGDLSNFVPPYQCGCYFESKLNSGVAPAGCQACAGAADCTNPARPACNNNFCEAQ
jgi:hypothetical protein